MIAWLNVILVHEAIDAVLGHPVKHHPTEGDSEVDEQVDLDGNENTIPNGLTLGRGRRMVSLSNWPHPAKANGHLRGAHSEILRSTQNDI